MVDLVNQLLSQGNAPWRWLVHASVAALRSRSLADLSSTRTARFLSGLFFGLVGGLALLTAGALLPKAFGYTPLVVVSGSMEPTLHAGDIAVTKKVTPDQVWLGDVVTYRSDPGLVTHRIVGLDVTPQVAFYQMKGDANASRDPQPVSIDQIETRVLYRIPRVGFLVTLVDSPTGVLLLIVAPLTMLGMWWRSGKAASAKRKSSPRRNSGGLPVINRLGLRSKKRKRAATPEPVEEVGASGARRHAVRAQGHKKEVFHVIPLNSEQE